jgi:hypothetical protein
MFFVVKSLPLSLSLSHTHTHKTGIGAALLISITVSFVLAVKKGTLNLDKLLEFIYSDEFTICADLLLVTSPSRSLSLARSLFLSLALSRSRVAYGCWYAVHIIGTNSYFMGSNTHRHTQTQTQAHTYRVFETMVQPLMPHTLVP